MKKFYPALGMWLWIVAGVNGVAQEAPMLPTLHAPQVEVTDAAAALVFLKEGNERFVADTTSVKREYTSDRLALAAAQYPFAVVICCSDSRVPPEIVFDQHLGDLFVVRVAGNILGPIELGSVEYAVEHLHVPLVVILGHESCGAVGAVVGAFGPHRVGEPVHGLSPNIRAIADLIRPSLDSALQELGETADAKILHERTCHHNIREMIRVVNDDPEIQQSHPTVVGAMYVLETGVVEWLDE